MANAISGERTFGVRVRFAPSPTGYMHVGNIRVALFNYLFAKQNNGTFILRIEDTDSSRTVADATDRILSDLNWLGLIYNEGPLVGGAYGPYEQSKRTDIYQEKLDELINMRAVYRCFCTIEELEEKRQRQIALKRPPRYDRTCTKLSDDMIKSKISQGTSFVWRFKVNQDSVLKIKNLNGSTTEFEMKNFSDFALTRADGSFTFIFANFVDDWTMEISHVIRAEDHLSNTAVQAALYDAFALSMPIFWHLPLMCNKDGAKLSKRDFGFSLEDLKKDGFLPHAILNYLAIIGVSVQDEIMYVEQLIKNLDFTHMHHSGSVKYDVEKLTWINHRWLAKLDLNELYKILKPGFVREFPDSKVSEAKILLALERLRPEFKKLTDAFVELKFLFVEPNVQKFVIEEKFGKEKTQIILNLILANLESQDFLSVLKAKNQAAGVSAKELFGTIRYLLTGAFEGAKIQDLIDIVGPVRHESILKLS